MSRRIIFNGELLPGGQPVAAAASRGLRYGDGLFETMCLLSGTIRNAALHFERLFLGLDRLHFDCPPHFTPALLEDQVRMLALENGHTNAARIRLMIFRGDGGLYGPVSHAPNWVIETVPLPGSALGLNSAGLTLGIYPDVRKTPDLLSSLKTNNFLPYLMAARFATASNWDDALLLNPAGRIADATTANLWWLEKGELLTPPLSEGAVAGTMRRFIMEQLPLSGWNTREEPLEPARLPEADAVFLTNAVYGLRWVGRFMDREFTPGPAEEFWPLLWQADL